MDQDPGRIFRNSLGNSAVHCIALAMPEGSTRLRDTTWNGKSEGFQFSCLLHELLII